MELVAFNRFPAELADEALPEKCWCSAGKVLVALTRLPAELAEKTVREKCWLHNFSSRTHKKCSAENNKIG